ncbi:MAG: glutamine synthetase family protein [Pseudomonadota bacterium]
MSESDRWLNEQNVVCVETIVADFAGLPRGKLQPIAEFAAKHYKLPVAVFGQTVNGTYHMCADNTEDRDMVVRPDLATLRMVPWAAEPTASVIMDCLDADGADIDVSPRNVLKRVLALFAAEGWHPVVAPEVEFYLESGTENESGKAPADIEDVLDPYGIDRVHDLGDFFRELNEHCRQQDITMGAISQELGPGQFEVNFEHGEALKLADDVFHFKRTLKRTAIAHGLRATFLSKLDAEKAGSSMHVHQSVYDEQGANIFSNGDGTASELFECYMGGLQTHLPAAVLMLAPYPNSYRRFLSYWSSPVNLEWDVDNRTVGLRVPESEPKARRIENRLAGSDVNPYLAIAATLACGYRGMQDQVKCRPAIKGSAYDLPFALHRHEYEALDCLRASEPLRETLGDDFVTLYTAVKERECREFQERIPPWEREELTVSI